MLVNLTPSDLELLLISLDTEILELVSKDKDDSYIEEYRSLYRKFFYLLNRV